MKRGLVLSGGGALGAYEVGALKALVEKGVRWDSVAGVSVGSINGAGIALMKGGLEQRLYKVEQFWRQIDNDSVYKKHAPWFLNYIWSFWKKSLYSMEPLEKFVYENLGKPEHRLDLDFRLGLVNLQTGRYHSVKIDKHLSAQQISKLIHASCVFPGLFKPVKLEGIKGLPSGEYVDGGIRDTIPVRTILMDKDISEIDVVITSPRNGHVTYKREFKSAVDVGLRAAFIMSDEVMLTDRIQGICQHHEVKLNLYAPSAPLRFDGFEFNQDAIGEMILQGYDETKAKTPPGH